MFSSNDSPATSGSASHPVGQTDLQSGESAALPAAGAASPNSIFNGEGTGGNDQDSAIAQSIKRASVDAVTEHEQSSRRGKRGPDKKPRRPRVPLAPMGNGAGDASLEDYTPSPLASVLPELPPEFDEESAREVVEFLLDLANDGVAGVRRERAFKETGDSQFAEVAAQEARMSPKLREKTSKGGVLCAKKWSIRMEWAPEIMFFGGFTAWGVQLKRQLNVIKAKGKELRALHGAGG